jgi:hypothetical protein
MPVLDALLKSLPFGAKYTQNRTGAITNSDNFDQSNFDELHCKPDGLSGKSHWPKEPER